MANATHEGQRFCYEITLNTEIAVHEINALRKDFASVCWRAYDSDPDFNYATALEELNEKIQQVLEDLLENDQDAIDKYQEIKENLVQ